MHDDDGTSRDGRTPWWRDPVARRDLIETAIAVVAIAVAVLALAAAFGPVPR